MVTEYVHPQTFLPVQELNHDKLSLINCSLVDQTEIIVSCSHIYYLKQTNYTHVSMTITSDVASRLESHLDFALIIMNPALCFSNLNLPSLKFFQVLASLVSFKKYKCLLS